MKQIARLFIATLAVALAFSVPYSSQAQMQHQHKTATTKTTTMYACPMHREITSDKPGVCSKCRMELVKQEPHAKQNGTENPGDKIEKVKSLLREAKRSLKSQGKYNCCIDNPCNQCALEHQSCPCYHDLKAEKPVCPECYGGWQRGEGKDSSIKPGDVKTKFNDHKH